MLKRSLDITFSVIGLILLSLPFSIIALLIKLDSPGPVFFRQERAGRGGRPFVIWKFRTMIHGSPEIGLRHTTSREDDRITRVGRVLRTLSLDELPQLINVLQGNMSLIGPRPTLPYQVERYTQRQRKRLDVKPGITSWAAVNGRNRLTWNERIALDIWYVEHQSFWLDMHILARTVWVAFITRTGVYADNGVNDDFAVPRREEQAKERV